MPRFLCRRHAPAHPVGRGMPATKRFLLDMHKRLFPSHLNLFFAQCNASCPAYNSAIRAKLAAADALRLIDGVRPGHIEDEARVWNASADSVRVFDL